MALRVDSESDAVVTTGQALPPFATRDVDAGRIAVRTASTPSLAGTGTCPPGSRAKVIRRDRRLALEYE